MLYRGALALGAGLLTALLAITATVSPTIAQKSGGTLRIYHRDNPPSASPHEESTVSVNLPFMAIYNNLVMFDPAKRKESLDTIVPDLAESWKWSDDGLKLTFKLRQGVTWHDGKAFSAKDVVCTIDMLTGKGDKGKELRKNPRAIWYHNVADVKANGDHEVVFTVKAPQPALLGILASGYSPIYPCHATGAQMRTNPIGTGPFKFQSFKRNESIRLVKNENYWKKGYPKLDAIEMRIIENRATRILAFQAGEFDMTFDADIVPPLMPDMKEKAPKAICDMRPTGVSNNLIINRKAAPFDNDKVREAFVLALDRRPFIEILGKGQTKAGGAMQPGPEGFWGMPQEMVDALPGYGNHDANIAKARQIMEGLGYGPGKELKLKVSTRNIAIYRDPAVILIDQLKKIHVAGELEVIDTTIWHAKITRGEYSVGLNLTGVAVDDPDVNLVENYTCTSERNVTGYCNKQVDELIFAQSRITDIAKRKAAVWEIEKRLIQDVARPIIDHNHGATCWHPHVKEIYMHENSIYNNWRFEATWLDK